jgi:hypothetical protein
MALISAQKTVKVYGYLGNVGLVLFRQQKCGAAAIGFGDDPDGIVAISVRRLVGIDRVGAQDEQTKAYGFIIGVGIFIFSPYYSPVAAHVAPEAVHQVSCRTGFECSRCGNDTARRKQLFRVHGRHLRRAVGKAAEGSTCMPAMRVPGIQLSH